jgi:hypothetical protein
LLLVVLLIVGVMRESLDTNPLPRLPAVVGLDESLVSEGCPSRGESPEGVPWLDGDGGKPFAEADIGSSCDQQTHRDGVL